MKQVSELLKKRQPQGDNHVNGLGSFETAALEKALKTQKCQKQYFQEQLTETAKYNTTKENDKAPDA